MEQNKYTNCLLCGKDNPIGLKLDFTYPNDQAQSTFTLEPQWEGYPGVVHGGMVTAILDEAMAKAILHTGITAMTIEINVKFKAPVAVGHPHTVTGSITQNKGRVLQTKAELTNTSGSLCATAEARFFKVKK